MSSKRVGSLGSEQTRPCANRPKTPLKTCASAISLNRSETNGTQPETAAMEALAMESNGELDRAVMAAVKAAEARGDPPLIQAMEAARCARESGSGFPNLDLGFVIVSNLCFDHNTPSLWKLLDQAMSSRVVSPLHALALLTARVIPNRRAQPEAYRLYLELLNWYLFSNHSIVGSAACRDKMTKLIDDSLQLSHTYGIHKLDIGHAVVFFVLSVILSLVDGTLEDWGLPFMSMDKRGNKNASEGHQVMNIDAKENSNAKKHEHREQLQRANSVMALKAVEKITANSKAKVFLRLIHFNMPEKFNALLQRLNFIEAHKSRTQNLLSVDHILVKLFTNVQEGITGANPLNKHRLLGILVDAGTSSPTSCYSSGTGRAGCWIPFDMFMETAMDGKNLHAISAIEILTELTKTLQVVNQASWQETFQALWVSALRLIQRDRNLCEGPMPRLEARLSMLLSIVPLAIAPVILEEKELPYPNNGYEHGMERNKYPSRRQGLVFSLQVLGQFSGLLSPPVPVATAANNAASRAATFISNFKSGSGNLTAISHNNTSVEAVGNLLHLIVDACIARKLIDTSAYFWPGYVVPSAPSKDSMLVQESPWSMFMEGSQLTGSLKNALIATPAPGIPEVDKLYHIALNGSEEEKVAAAKILCGASLIYGWNIQEHVIHILVRLLSPPVPTAFTEPGNASHLIRHMPMLGSILFVVARVEVVHIFSLYGMVPEVTAVLMPLCEAFGSLAPGSNYKSNLADETSIYSVFSCAFLFLLRLWRFYKPPQEKCLAGRGGTVRVELTLDYLLLMRNSRIALQNSTARDRCNSNADSLNPSPDQPVYIDSFPKLQAWYLQNQACIASTLSGLCSKNPVHQVANKILSMLYGKLDKVGTVSSNPSSNSSGSISGSPVITAEDAYQKPILPAWEVLEAVPFVLEAILTACAHGKLSSRDLTTGLRDLVDYLPASLATIVSYFSAEITRGVWKPVKMDGKDWPNPEHHLVLEAEIKEILASAGVQVSSSYLCGKEAMLPLPMAALVSLTITSKLERNLEYLHVVIGQALENCSTGCSWPSMPIIGALWIKKVKRWRDFVVFSCTLSPFTRDKDAVTQLICSCFSSFFGYPGSSPHLTSHRGVSGLLGDSMSDKRSFLPIAPGFLYLRTCRTFHDTHFVSNTILALVIEWSHNLAAGCNSSSPACLKSGQTSQAAAAAAVREVAALGASLMCIAGGGRMVQVLYEEILPAVLMSVRECGEVKTSGPASVLEGYAMAYLLVLSGACVWGAGQTAPAFASVFSSRRGRAISVHLEFVAGVVDGNVAVGCGEATFKAYVSCLVGLLVGFVPAWVPEIRKETLRKLANGLRGWRESELALELLERGGPEELTSVVESLL